MMYLIWLLVAVVASADVSPTPIASTCPRGCNCNDASTAVCDTLDLEPFGFEISNLKIVNPSKPLVLTKGVFHDLGLKTVNYIRIENATISKVDEQAFSQLMYLTALSILGCDVLEFPSNIVSTVNTLRSLNLSGSKLHNFSAIISESIEEVDMSNCQLSEISEVAFNNLQELTYLNLENNRISKIHPLAFVNLSDLEELLLSKNNLSHLMPNLLENNIDLVTLDLSYNPIGHFNLNIISFLERLVLRGCGLKSFNTTSNINFNLLPSLDLSENEIELIEKSTFVKMEKLETINLSNNKLETLDAAVFDSNSNLIRIILDNNNIKELPKFTNKNGYFEMVSFSCNNCSLIKLSPETFTYMRGVSILRLSNNKLEDINPEVFENTPGLRELDISSNNISEFKPNTFGKLHDLEQLNISENPLKQPLDANMFYNNKVLRTLDASTCHLDRLWSENTLLYSSMPSIEQLIIANNSLRSVDPRDLQVLTNLRMLDIRNNPLECSQTLRDTITWLTVHGVYPSSSDIKTHESLNKDAAAFEETKDKLPSWKKLAKDACEDEDYFDNYDNEEIEVHTQHIIQSPDNDIKSYNEGSEEYDDDEEDYSSYIDYDLKTNENNEIEVDDDENDDDKLFDEVKTEIDLEKLAIESRRFREKSKEDAYSYLSPTLVFILTAASVLVIAANVMLLILRSRGALVSHRESNLPHFKILQWGTVNKLKKHSGSVYQQLSEEKSAPATPKVNRYQKLPTVHNSNP